MPLTGEAALHGAWAELAEHPGATEAQSAGMKGTACLLVVVGVAHLLLLHADCEEMEERFLCAHHHLFNLRQLMVCVGEGGIKTRWVFSGSLTLGYTSIEREQSNILSA